MVELGRFAVWCLLCQSALSGEWRKSAVFLRLEFPQILLVPFLVKLFLRVVLSGADVLTALNSRGGSTGFGHVVHARCCVWCR